MNKMALIGLIAIIVIGVVALFAYRSYQNNTLVYNPSPAPLASAQESIKETVEEIKNTKTVMLDEQNGSGEKGTAILTELTEEEGKVKVVIEVLGEPDGAVQPAHIHAGACPTPGAIKYALTNVVGGKSETTINTTLEALEAAGPLAINIHESSGKLNNYIACGDVDF